MEETKIGNICFVNTSVNLSEVAVMLVVVAPGVVGAVHVEVVWLIWWFSVAVNRVVFGGCAC